MGQLPDEVQEGISWADILDLLLFSEFILRAFARVDNQNHNDANKHCDESGGHIVYDGTHSHLSRGTTVQRCHA